MQHAIGSAPTSSQIDAAREEERFALFRAVLDIDERLQSVASRDCLDYARRSWQAAFTGEQPALHLVGRDEP